MGAVLRVGGEGCGQRGLRQGLQRHVAVAWARGGNGSGETGSEAGCDWRVAFFSGLEVGWRERKASTRLVRS